MYGSQAQLWDQAGIKRAAKAVADRQARKPACGYAPKLPRSDVAFAIGAEGRGVTCTDSTGRDLRMQVWAPAKYVRTYWYLVIKPSFPGEVRLVTLDKDGCVASIDGTVYNAQGHKAHAHDGTACYGYQAPDGCPGCNAESIRGLVGRHVRVSVDGDPMYGRTLRWGTLREVRDGSAVFDGYCDSNGVREYSARQRSHTGNDVTVQLSSIHEIRAA
jgi:hypothetical protein